MIMIRTTLKTTLKTTLGTTIRTTIGTTLMILNIMRPKFQLNFSEGERSNLKQSNKDSAFRLCSEGKTLTSPEVKALGLHSSNRYKYFYKQNRLGQPSEHQPGQARSGQVQTQTSVVSFTSSSGEAIGSIDETKATKRKDQEKQSINSEAQMQEDLTSEEDQEEPWQDGGRVLLG